MTWSISKWSLNHPAAKIHKRIWSICSDRRAAGTPPFSGHTLSGYRRISTPFSGWVDGAADEKSRGNDDHRLDYSKNNILRSVSCLCDLDCFCRDWLSIRSSSPDFTVRSRISHGRIPRIKQIILIWKDREGESAELYHQVIKQNVNWDIRGWQVLLVQLMRDEMSSFALSLDLMDTTTWTL